MPRQTGTMLLVCYAVAAATSLAHEAVWMKRLGLLFGASLPAAATTLAVFFLGMAGGGAMVGRFYRDHHGPARWLGGLQVGLGAWTIALPGLFTLAGAAYEAVAPPGPSPLHHGLRLAVAGALLLPPAVALGAVFPVVSAAGVRRVFAVGMGGSVFGAITAVVWLMPGLGLTRSMGLLGAVNLGVGLAAFSLPPGVWPADAPSRDRIQAPREGLARTGWQVALLGAGLFAAQAVWFRLIWLVVDATFYAEGMVITAVLASMALGAAAAARWQPPARWVLAATAVAQVGLVLLMHPIALGWDAAKGQVIGSFETYLAGQAVVAWAVTGPAGFGYGMAIPLLCRRFDPAAVGRLWSVHHLGGAAGALGSAFVAIPLLGVTAVLGVASLAVAAALWLDRARWLAGGVAVAALALGAWGDATYRQAAAGTDHRLVFHHEDGAGIVEVYENRRTGARRMLSDRLRQEGGSGPEQVRAERMQGRLPLWLHPDPGRVLVVGLGTGITLGASLDERVERLTCVEISEGVIRAARLFEQPNRGVLDDPRVALVHQDGRGFIRLADQRYDLIVQELFHPYRAGTGAMYTVEHFTRCRDRLTPGGRMAQWIHTLQITPEALRTLARSFAEVFPHVSLWMFNGQLMLLGGEQPIRPGPDNPALRYFIAADSAVRRWVSGAARNTEDNLRLEHRLPQAFDRLNSVALIAENLEPLLGIQQSVTVLGEGMPGPLSEAARLRYRGILARHRGDRAKAVELYERSFELDPGSPPVRRFLLAERLRRKQWAAALALDPAHPEANHNRGVQLYRAHRYRAAAAHFRRALDHPEVSIDAAFNLANCQAHLGRYTVAVRLYERVLRHRPDHADALHNLGEIRRHTSGAGG